MAIDARPELRAVVGVGQVAELVDAHILGHEIGCADQPPVEADAAAAAAHAPKGFGVGKCGGGGEYSEMLKKVTQDSRTKTVKFLHRKSAIHA